MTDKRRPAAVGFPSGEVAGPQTGGGAGQNRRPGAVGLRGGVGSTGGELAAQQRAGVAGQAARLAPMMSRGELRSGLAAFLSETTFAALTARDRTGRLWTSPLLGPPGLLRAASSTTLGIDTTLPTADPLHGLPDGQPV